MGVAEETAREWGKRPGSREKAEEEEGVLYIRRGRAIFAEVKKSMSLWFAPVPYPSGLPQCHVPLVCPSAMSLWFAPVPCPSGLPQCPVPFC